MADVSPADAGERHSAGAAILSRAPVGLNTGFTLIVLGHPLFPELTLF